jgi:hypothetical protein
MKDPNNSKPNRLQTNLRLAICDDTNRNQENKDEKEIKNRWVKEEEGRKKSDLPLPMKDSPV